MAKIFSPRAEVQALKALCSKKREVSGLMLASLNKSFFHRKESIEIYERILKFNERKGNVPSLQILQEELVALERSQGLLS